LVQSGRKAVSKFELPETQPHEHYGSIFTAHFRDTLFSGF